MRRFAEPPVHGPTDAALPDPDLLTRYRYDGLRLRTPSNTRAARAQRTPAAHHDLFESA
jgi:hypothetical protein